MSQNDFVIANDTAANVRADINLALQALASQSSGATAPATTYANMLWYDTATNFLYMRSEADDAWIKLGTLNQSTNTFSAEVDALDTSDWEAGTGTTEAVISPAKLAAGIAALAGGGGGLTSVQTLTASGTYTRPAGITKVLFFITGGGAGGASSDVSGQSGATAIKFLDVTSIATSTIVIGAGGAGDGFTQSLGGNSSWSDGTNTVTGEGGKANASSTNSSGGDLNISGGDGSFWGGTSMVQGSTPQAANVFGAGGAGGTTSGSRFGGSGKSGVLFVMEFS
jgi:hypothetical protein